MKATIKDILRRKPAVTAPTATAPTDTPIDDQSGRERNFEQMLASSTETSPKALRRNKTFGDFASYLAGGPSPSPEPALLATPSPPPAPAMTYRQLLETLLTENAGKHPQTVEFIRQCLNILPLLVLTSTYVKEKQHINSDQVDNSLDAWWKSQSDDVKERVSTLGMHLGKARAWEQTVPQHPSDLLFERLFLFQVKDATKQADPYEKIIFGVLFFGDAEKGLKPIDQRMPYTTKVLNDKDNMHTLKEITKSWENFIVEKEYANKGVSK